MLPVSWFHPWTFALPYCGFCQGLGCPSVSPCSPPGLVLEHEPGLCQSRSEGLNYGFLCLATSRSLLRMPLLLLLHVLLSFWATSRCFRPRPHSAASDRSFELVSSVSDPEVSSPPRSRVLETRDSIQRSFEPCPVRLFSHCARLCGSSLSGKERVERGQWAGAVRAELWCRARSGSSGFRRRFQVTHGNPAEVFPALGFPARFRKAVGDTSEDYFFCLSFFPQLQNFALLWGL